MRKICVSLFVNGVCLYILSQLFPTIAFQSEELVMLTLIFGLLNITIKPILKFLSFPISILTLGLFRIVINGFVLYLALTLATHLQNIPYMTCLIAGIVFSIMNSALHSILDK